MNRANRGIRITDAPARYKFNKILNLTDEEVRAYGQPNIREWSWHSAHELRTAAVNRLSLKWGDQPVALGASLEELLKLKGFTDLNLPPDRFTWFINVGEGHLFVDRSPKACPFEDDDLYVPALWGKRIITATQRGFVSVRQVVEGQKIYWKGFYPDTTMMPFGEGLFSD